MDCILGVVKRPLLLEVRCVTGEMKWVGMKDLLRGKNRRDLSVSEMV